MRDGIMRAMKRLIVVLFLSFFLLISVRADAFLYEIDFLTKDQIKELSDEAIVEAHTEAKIEEKASAEFHIGAGFSSAKEYRLRKDLLRLIIYLRREMILRGVEIEPIEQWLR